jgi:chromosome segregation ATPase
MMKLIFLPFALLLSLVMPGSAVAQPASLESRLRDQLRQMQGQMQDMQGQQAQLQSRNAALEAERDAAKKDAEAARAELASSKGRSSGDAQALAAERGRQQALQATADRYKHDYDQSATSARASEAERTRLAGQLEQANAKLGTCAAKNIQLYDVGKEILDAYEHIDMGQVMSARQPFAASSRVRLENAAQAFGDKLYDQRFDPASQAPGR